MLSEQITHTPTVTKEIREQWVTFTCCSSTIHSNPSAWISVTFLNTHGMVLTEGEIIFYFKPHPFVRKFKLFNEYFVCSVITLSLALFWMSLMSSHLQYFNQVFQYNILSNYWSMVRNIVLNKYFKSEYNTYKMYFVKKIHKLFKPLITPPPRL